MPALFCHCALFFFRVASQDNCIRTLERVRGRKHFKNHAPPVLKEVAADPYWSLDPSIYRPDCDGDGAPATTTPTLPPSSSSS
jgi:hypothetical protein